MRCDCSEEIVRERKGRVQRQHNAPEEDNNRHPTVEFVIVRSHSIKVRVQRTIRVRRSEFEGEDERQELLVLQSHHAVHIRVVAAECVRQRLHAQSSNIEYIIVYSLH